MGQEHIQFLYTKNIKNNKDYITAFTQNRSKRYMFLFYQCVILKGYFEVVRI